MSTNRLMTFELLDRMEQLLSEAWAVPLTKKFMLDKEEFSSLMRRLEESIPVDVQNAKTIIDQEENIINESNRIAEETTRNASAEAQATVDNAKQEANAMVNDAQARAAPTPRPRPSRWWRTAKSWPAPRPRPRKCWKAPTATAKPTPPGYTTPSTSSWSSWTSA